MVPFRNASDGITLFVVPAWICVTETTAWCDEGTLRLMIVCIACPMAQAATTGSRASSGMAPCPPTPRSVIVN